MFAGQLTNHLMFACAAVTVLPPSYHDILRHKLRTTLSLNLSRMKMRNSQKSFLYALIFGSVYDFHQFTQAFSNLSPVVSLIHNERTPKCLRAVATEETNTISQKSVAQPISVSGHVSGSPVDMNRYNLDESEIPEEWTANLKAATDMTEAGAFLGAKNSQENFVDTMKMVIPCPQPGAGLGIEILELAGGRSDGLGITIVSGLVVGKCAESSGLQFGDSIAQISLRRRVRDGESSSLQEIQSVATECLAYDGTIDAILSILDTSTSTVHANEAKNDLVLVFTVKRLRRKPKVQMRLQYPPSQGEPDISLELFAGENLRRALLARGVKLNDPLARRFDNGGSGDCGAEGTCATCAVNVIKGGELLSPPGDSESQIMKRNPRWRMACKVIVGHSMQEGELTVRVNPRQW